MRSIPLLAATSFIALGVWACGDDNGPNTNPVAAFTQQCTDLNCTFTDQSTPADRISTRTWDFGDPNSAANNTASGPTATHAFTAAGTYNVKLTVTDVSGATDDQTNAVTVSTTSGNQPPVASFTLPVSCTVGAACAFIDTSTDPDGTVAGWTWNFGDSPTTDPNQHPTHTYLTAGTFNVTLTVTDNLGAASTPVTQTLTVSPATASECTPVGTGTTDLVCNLTLSQRSTVTITLDDEDCELGGNRVSIPPPEPRAQNVFTNVCSQPITPVDYTLLDPAGLPLVFEAGTVLPIQFHRGEPGLGDPPAGPPQAQLESTAANTWTISIDDGGDAAAPRDFTDVLLTVVATPAP